VTILDTSVISELMRPTPEPLVLQWFNRLSADDAHLTSITVAEILLGIELLPLGKRRDLMRAGAERTLGVFAGQVLSFDEKAAHAFSLVSSTRRRHGRIMSDFDAQIAAIARVHGAILATRYESDFEGCGVTIMNPWQA
jgi:toxin FitB